MSSCNKSDAKGIQQFDQEKVGRWLRKRLSSGSSEKKKKDPSSKSPRSWKASLGGMWAKATEVASNASKNLRNMKSSDDDPSSYVLVLVSFCRVEA